MSTLTVLAGWVVVLAPVLVLGIVWWLLAAVGRAQGHDTSRHHSWEEPGG